MKNQGILLIFLFCIYYFSYAQSAKLEFVDIDCPEEIIIHDNMDLNKLEILYNIKLKYLGEDIVYSKSQLKCTSPHPHENLNVFGEIYFIDNKGRILPGALKQLRKHGLGMGGWNISGANLFLDEKYTALKKNEIYSWDFFLISGSGFFEETDIDEALKKKILYTIVLIIKKVELVWELQGCKINPKGKIELEVNRIKIISIKYKDKTDLKVMSNRL